ncbi:hypothetical protein Rhopal_007621-T1 [Rhodotorula paludigena]|uniref:Uncharacterized protein n=1 Tax=Rhodotorula paludigena TaxID=86838 RepID=A0AAV5H1C6_9BASI|nr:hypothetical protein Rhopal_007621-T1 [Rhodotorula paludigena]
MAQGFKSKPPANTHKAKSTTQKKLQPKDPKKGGKSPLKNTSAHSSSIEKGIAAQALGHGKLTIMRGAAEDSKKAADK